MYFKVFYLFVVSPTIQFGGTGFFGTTDNTAVAQGTTFVNGVATDIAIIGYDTPDSSIAGPTEKFTLSAGTVITFQVRYSLFTLNS